MFERLTPMLLFVQDFSRLLSQETHVKTQYRRFDYNEQPVNLPINHNLYGPRFDNWKLQLKAKPEAYRCQLTTEFNSECPCRVCQRPSAFGELIKEFESYFSYLVTVVQNAQSNERSSAATFDRGSRHVER